VPARKNNKKPVAVWNIPEKDTFRTTTGFFVLRYAAAIF
jgi:hypothetical protein